MLETVDKSTRSSVAFTRSSVTGGGHVHRELKAPVSRGFWRQDTAESLHTVHSKYQAHFLQIPGTILASRIASHSVRQLRLARSQLQDFSKLGQQLPQLRAKPTVRRSLQTVRRSLAWTASIASTRSGNSFAWLDQKGSQQGMILTSDDLRYRETDVLR